MSAFIPFLVLAFQCSSRLSPQTAHEVSVSKNFILQNIKYSGAIVGAASVGVN